jgi:hypothetical protein
VTSQRCFSWFTGGPTPESGRFFPAARRPRPRQGLGQPGLDRQPAHDGVQPRRRQLPRGRQRRLPRTRPRRPERTRRHAPRLHVVRRRGRLLHRLRRHHSQGRQARRRRGRLLRHADDPPLLGRRPSSLQGRRPDLPVPARGPPPARATNRSAGHPTGRRSPTRPAATSTRSTSARSPAAAAASASRSSS